MPVSTPTWKIAVIAGGDSDEAEISLESGANVQRALTQRGHFVLHLDPAIMDLRTVDWRQFDVTFIALHGHFGEDGQVQRILDDAGVPYTGSGPDASRLAFSKSAAKERFLQHGIPTPAYALIHYSDDVERLRLRADELGYPLIIKPESQGSSLGLSLVQHADELDAAFRSCFHFDCFGLMEAAILGEEWTVAVFDGQALTPLKIESRGQLFDYQAKYVDEVTQYSFDERNPQLLRSLQETAAAACQSLGVTGMARVDLRLDAAGLPSVLEVNTIPGMTGHSLVPKIARQHGWDFASLCEKIVSSALHAGTVACALPIRQSSPAANAPQTTSANRKVG